MIKEEIWKDIPNYNGLYQISNLGRIKSLKSRGNRDIILCPRNKRGYLEIGLKRNGNHKFYLVHRLVAQVFIDNPNNLPCVNHKDEDKTNNCVDNLEWCTYRYNNCYGTRISKVIAKTGKPVAQYNLDNDMIRVFPSLAEAGRNVNRTSANIHECCTGNVSNCAGYIWKYYKGDDENAKRI